MRSDGGGLLGGHSLTFEMVEKIFISQRIFSRSFISFKLIFSYCMEHSRIGPNILNVSIPRCSALFFILSFCILRLCYVCILYDNSEAQGHLNKQSTNQSNQHYVKTDYYGY